MGHFLTDSLRPLFHLTGTEENYAFVTPEAIYEKKHSGRIVVTDSLLNPIDHPMSPQLLKEVLEYKNRFRKKTEPRLYRNRSFDMRMGIVAGQFEIFIAETQNILHSRIDMHLR